MSCMSLNVLFCLLSAFSVIQVSKFNAISFCTRGCLVSLTLRCARRGYRAKYVSTLNRILAFRPQSLALMAIPRDGLTEPALA